jgi:hypothetical protein
MRILVQVQVSADSEKTVSGWALNSRPGEFSLCFKKERQKLEVALEQLPVSF